LSNVFFKSYRNYLKENDIENKIASLNNMSSYEVIPIYIMIAIIKLIIKFYV